jgi:hypothetical protein
MPKQLRPVGRPLGSLNNNKKLLAEKLQENEDEFIECLMKMIRKGDPTAMKIYAYYAWGQPPRGSVRDDVSGALAEADEKKVIIQLVQATDATIVKDNE